MAKKFLTLEQHKEKQRVAEYNKLRRSFGSKITKACREHGLHFVELALKFVENNPGVLSNCPPGLTYEDTVDTYKDAIFNYKEKLKLYSI